MSDVYDIWLYPLQDWWRTVEEMYTGQMGNLIFHPVLQNAIRYKMQTEG